MSSRLPKNVYFVIGWDIDGHPEILDWDSRKKVAKSCAAHRRRQDEWISVQLVQAERPDVRR